MGAIKFIDDPTLEIKRLAIKSNEESINFISNYDLDDLEIFIADNIKVVKYLCGSIEPETVVKVLIKKLDDDDFTEEYIKDFLNLEVLEMDKIKFIWECGNKRARKILVDYMLSK